MISGVVIPFSLHSSHYTDLDFVRFLAHLMLRLEPPYIASIILTVVLLTISSHLQGLRGTKETYEFGRLLAHSLYLTPLTHFHLMQPVYSSLAYELVFYVAVGLTFTRLWPGSLALTVIAAAVAIALKWSVTGTWDALLPLFVLGIGTARYYVRHDSLGVYLLGLAVALGAILAMGSLPSALVGMATALVIAFMRTPVWPPVNFLGSISSSLYLTHVPIGVRTVNLCMRFGAGPYFEFFSVCFRARRVARLRMGG